MTTWADEKAMALVRAKVAVFRNGMAGIRYDYPPNLGITNRILVHRTGKILKWKNNQWEEIASPRFRAAILMALWPEWAPDDMG